MKLMSILLATVTLVACSDSGSDQIEKTDQSSHFSSLPASSSERVVLKGKMSFWMYEGSAGCYGELMRGTEAIQLWVDAESCADKEFAENQDTSVEVTFNPDNQYGPGKTYTITKFL